MKALTLLKEVSSVPQPLLCPTVINRAAHRSRMEREGVVFFAGFIDYCIC